MLTAEAYTRGWTQALAPHPLDCRCQIHRPDLHIVPARPPEKASMATVVPGTYTYVWHP
jgi:hypothetical protein